MIINVFVLSDSNNIKCLRKTEANKISNKYRENKESIDLYNQILINSTHTIIIEVFYLLFLNIQMFLQNLLCDTALIFLLTTNVFILFNILRTLLVSVREKYLVF